MPNYSPGVKYKIFYSPTTILLFSIVFLQAIIFKWDLGTMVWIYWVEGIIIAVLGIFYSIIKKTPILSFAFIFFFCILMFFGIFLTSASIPIQNASYQINGQPVTAEEFITLKDISWVTVAANAIIILIFNIVLFSTNINGDHISSSLGTLSKRMIPTFIIIFIVFFAPWSVLIFIAFKALLSFEITSDENKKGIISFTIKPPAR
jgi:hypothetical protein